MQKTIQWTIKEGIREKRGIQGEDEAKTQIANDTWNYYGSKQWLYRLPAQRVIPDLEIAGIFSAFENKVTTNGCYCSRENNNS